MSTAKKLKPGLKAGAKRIKDRVKCSRGHAYKKHGYKDTAGNMRCRACTKLGAHRYADKLAKLNERRAKAKKGAVKKLHGIYAGEKKKKKAKKAAPKKADVVFNKLHAQAKKKKARTPGLGPVRIQSAGTPADPSALAKVHEALTA